MTPRQKEIAEDIFKTYPWYAVHEDGKVFLYVNEPVLDTFGYWHGFRPIRIGTRDMTGVDWRETKERVG